MLAETIRGEIKDPRIAPFTSVVAVEVAPDLKTCRAWISVLGDEKAQEDTLAGLKSAEGFLKSRSGKGDQSAHHAGNYLCDGSVHRIRREHVA